MPQYYTITGIEGLDVWPGENVVVNVIPDSEVVIRELPPNRTVAVEVDQHGAAIVTIPSVGGSITVPSETFVDAFVNRLSLRLVVDGNYYGGTISFLPRQESIPFELNGFYTDNGSVVSTSTVYKRTDLLSVEDVVDIVYSGTSRNDAKQLVAFDSNRSFVKVLLNNGTAVNAHVVPDGTYAYIAASARKDGESSLVLYFRRRRR